MPDDAPQFLNVGCADSTRRIAYLHQPAKNDDQAGVIWLQGFKSEMVSLKATAIADWARTNDVGLTRFDYSGHGRSDGRFEDGTISRWLEEAVAVVRQVTQGPQILVGSSMGAWLALLVLRALSHENALDAHRIQGLVLIAPAWDMTETLMWQRFSEEVRATLLADGMWQRPSRYGDGDYPITRRLIEDGRKHLIASGEPLDPGCPVRILHGMDDPDVPWQHGMRLMDVLTGPDMRITLIKDGEHRLSQPSDLAVLTATLDDLLRLDP